MFVPRLIRQPVYGECTARLSGETYEKIIDGVIFDNGFSNR